MKCTIACFCFHSHLFSILSPSWRKMQGDLGLYTQVTYAVILSFLLVCSQASAFFACRIVFCVTFLVDCITLQDLIFDSRSYCSSKSSKSLRSCGKVLSPFVVTDAAGTSVCCRIVTPLSLHFYSLREGSSTFRGYTASCVALKAWDWVMYG